MRNGGGLSILLSLVVASWQSKFEGHIVGGKYTVIHRVPHSVFLMMTSDEEWICGSSVLTQQILLTAAHCINECRLDANCKIVAYAGHENLAKIKVLRKVEKYAVHENYNQQKAVHDVAVVLLERPLHLGPHIKRVILLKRSRVKAGDTGTVAGWGFIDDINKRDAMKLKAARVTIRSRGWCEYIGNLNSGMFCAGSFKASNGRPVEGDSGSALVMDNYQQIGLVSFKIEEYPALVVYTNVSYYFRWIRHNSIKLICKKRRGWTN